MCITTHLCDPAARHASHHASHLQVHSAGQLLTRDFVSMLPFTDELVVLELSGGAVLTALETGVGSYPALEGRFLQVRGGVVGCSLCVVL